MAKYFFWTIAICFVGILSKVFWINGQLQTTAAQPTEVAAAASTTTVDNATTDTSADILPTSSSEAVIENKPKKLLRIAFNQNPPRKYVENGQAKGIAAAIIREFAARYGANVQFDLCALPECERKIKAGLSDALLEVAINPQRAELVDFLKPEVPVSAAQVYYQRADDTRTIRTIEDLHGLNVGVLRGYSYYQAFDGNRAIKRVVYPGLTTMSDALFAKKIDAFIGAEDRSDFFLSKNGRKAHLKKAFYQVREVIQVHFLALAKNSPLQSDKSRIEALLQSMYDDGSLARIAQAEVQSFRVAYTQ